MDKYNEVQQWVIDRESLFTDLSTGDDEDHKEADRQSSGDYIILFDNFYDFTLAMDLMM